MKNSSLFNIRLFGIEKQKSVFKTVYITGGKKVGCKMLERDNILSYKLYILTYFL